MNRREPVSDFKCRINVLNRDAIINSYTSQYDTVLLQCSGGIFYLRHLLCLHLPSVVFEFLFFELIHQDLLAEVSQDIEASPV